MEGDLWSPVDRLIASFFQTLRVKLIQVIYQNLDCFPLLRFHIAPVDGSEISTVKASNLAPHGNFGPILRRSVASLDEFYTKHEQRTYFANRKFFCHFYALQNFVGRFLMISSPPKNDNSPMLEALTVLF
jgi:hypothetical protein